jgi:uncharacterized membrane protein YphA (DoxX/SURF4 family)
MDKFFSTFVFCLCCMQGTVTRVASVVVVGVVVVMIFFSLNSYKIYLTVTIFD